MRLARESPKTSSVTIFGVHSTRVWSRTSTLAPTFSTSSRTMSISSMRGKLWSTTGSSVRSEATIILEAAFLAPEMTTSPSTRWGPVIFRNIVGER